MQRSGGAPLEATDDGSAAMADAKESLALWLRAGRSQRKLSLEDVARITKIQPRILDKLERGELEGLPADVFVRGFVRSFAKCVGLDESEAIVRYGACRSGEAATTPVARALVESMGLAAARKAQGTPAQPTPVVAQPVVETAPVAPVVSEPVVETAPVAPVVDVAPVTKPVIEQIAEAIVEAAALEVSAPVIASTNEVSAPTNEVVAAVAVEQPSTGKAKRSRKKGSRKSKKTEQQVIAQTRAVEVARATEIVAQPIETAPATEIVAQQIETGPIAKIDAASLETTAIELKSEPSNGSVDEPQLAEGSQRITGRAIEVVVADEIARASNASNESSASNGSNASPETTIDTSSSIETVDATNSTADATLETSEPEVAGSWKPTMPPIPTTPSVPWRRPTFTASRAYVMPTLVIDDADPDSADREREDRSNGDGKEHRLSFLPPILLDREDRSARQGGLTLAVIILLIAATLTLSYLMRRPSASGDGVTMLDGTTQIVS